MSDIQLRPLFKVAFDVDPEAYAIGRTCMGSVRRNTRVTGGWFRGERLSGKVLPGGGDWVVARPDGVFNLDVRATLQATSGELIYMTFSGRRGGPPEVREKLLRGEAIPLGTDYFRILVQFEVAQDAGLSWLNDLVAVGSGVRHPAGPEYDVCEIV